MAKSPNGHVSFQFETRTPGVPVLAACCLLMALAAALPAILVLDRRDTARPVPYLEVDVSGAPGALAGGGPAERLNPGG